MRRSYLTAGRVHRALRDPASRRRLLGAIKKTPPAGLPLSRLASMMGLTAADLRAEFTNTEALYRRLLAHITTEIAEGLRTCSPPADSAPSAIAACYVSTAVQVFSSEVGSSRVDLQACKLEYSIVSPK